MLALLQRAWEQNLLQSGLSWDWFWCIQDASLSRFPENSNCERSKACWQIISCGLAISCDLEYFCSFSWQQTATITQAKQQQKMNAEANTSWHMHSVWTDSVTEQAAALFPRFLPKFPPCWTNLVACKGPRVLHLIFTVCYICIVCKYKQFKCGHDGEPVPKGL